MRTCPAIMLLMAITGAASAQDATILRHHHGWVSSVAFSADSRYLASASGDRTVRVHDLTKETPDRFVFALPDVVCAVAFSAKTNSVAAACFDGTVKLEGLGQTLRGQRGAILAMALSPSGRLATGAMDGTIVVWTPRLTSLTMIPSNLKPHQSWVNALAFDNDGVLASASSDNTVRLYSLVNKTIIASFDFPEGEVRSLAFSPDGKTLVAGLRYGTIKVIDLPTKKVATHKSHAADVWAVAFSPDGKTFASGDGDWDRPGDVRLWDTTSWKEKKLLKTTGEVLSLAYSPDGRYLAAGCWDKTVHLWRLDKQNER